MLHVAVGGRAAESAFSAWGPSKQQGIYYIVHGEERNNEESLIRIKYIPPATALCSILLCANEVMFS